jgi:hypothetical protein
MFLKNSNIFFTKNQLEDFLKNPLVKISNKEIINSKITIKGNYKISDSDHVEFSIKKINQTQEQDQTFILPEAYFSVVEWFKNNKAYRKKGPLKITYEAEKMMLSYFFDANEKTNKPAVISKFRKNGTTHFTWKDEGKDINRLSTNISNTNKVIEKIFHIQDESLFLPNTFYFNFKRELIAAIFIGESETPIIIDKDKDIDNLSNILNCFSINPYYFNNSKPTRELSNILLFNFGK